MRFIVCAIDTESAENIYVSGDNYVSYDTYEVYREEEAFEGYESLSIDDLVGLSEVFDDVRARNEAINQILYGSVGLHALRIIANEMPLTEKGHLLADLDAVHSKLHSIGLGYLSAKKTYLIESMGSFRKLLHAHIDIMHTIRMSQQVWTFIEQYLGSYTKFVEPEFMSYSICDTDSVDSDEE